MADEAHTLAYGVTYDMVAARTASGQLLTLTSHRGNNEIPPHKHTNDYLCIVLGGGFAERERNAWHERERGCFFTHHSGETHYDRFGPRGAMCVNLHFAAGQPEPLNDGNCSALAVIAASRLALELAASVREELVMASLAAEIMGELGPRRQKPERGRWIGRLVQAIGDEPVRRWSLQELALVAERHPVHVAQSFRAATGISLGAYQRLRRLTLLCLSLRNGETQLASLAAEFGYFDQSHMTSEFRRAFGVSPGRYRREFH